MSGRRLFVPPGRFGAATLTVTGSDHRYLARVLRAKRGQEVTLFDGAGGEVLARVGRVGRVETELVLGDRPARGRAEGKGGAGAVPIVLLAAVPRGGRMDLLVQKTTELGVSRIVPVLSQRSVARPEPDRCARWEKIAREAARQCRRADVPAIALPVELSAAVSGGDLPDLRIALYESESDRSFRSVLLAPQPTALLVGPEGGFTDEEIAGARAAGFLPAGLGPRILRAETAAIVAVALVQYTYGGLG